MIDRLTRLERAFALAKSGRMADLTDIRHTLRAEGYVDRGEFGDSEIKAQLKKLVADANHNRRHYAH